MRRLIFTILFTLSSALAGAYAQQAPVKQAPLQPGAADKLTMRDCITILAGLTALDGRRVIVGAGKATETAETIPYKFAPKVRGAISRNLFVLGNVQQEVQAANRRAQERIGKGQPITPGSKENIEFDREMNDYLDRPCKAELDHLSEADLKVDENDLPGTVVSALWKILDR